MTSRNLRSLRSGTSHGLVVRPVPYRRRRPRRFLVIISLRRGIISLRRGFVAVAIRRAPAPHPAIAPRKRSRPGSIGSVGIIAVVTVIMMRRPGVAPLDIFAFDVAPLVDEA